MTDSASQLAAPRFVLAPLDHICDAWRPERAAPRFPVHATWRGDLGVGNSLYLLRIWNNHLYFTTAPQNSRSVVWSCFDALTASRAESFDWENQPQKLVDWWLNQVENSRFGVLSETSGGGNEFLIFTIFGPNGTGRARLWWNDRVSWPFDWPLCEAGEKLALLAPQFEPYSLELLWHFRWNMVNRDKIYGCESEFTPQEIEKWAAFRAHNEEADEDDFGLGDALQRLEAPENNRVDGPFRARRGSWSEWIELMTAIAHLETGVWGQETQIHAEIVSASPFEAAFSRFSWHQSPLKTTTLFSSWTRSSVLNHLLQQDFGAQGWVWENYSEREDGRRARWHCLPYAHDWDIQAPTGHEVLAARDRVRAWLQTFQTRGQLRAEQIETILSLGGILQDPAPILEDLRKLTHEKPGRYDA